MPTPRKSRNPTKTPSTANDPAPADGEKDTGPAPIVTARTSYTMVVRMHKLHQILFEQQQRDNGVRPWIKTEQLADELETSERTICETIARMRDDHGLPAYYVAKRKGIGYTAPVTTMPTIVYTQLDSMALCFAMAGMAVIEGTPYADAGRQAIRKMTSGMRKELAVPAAQLEKAVSFHCTGADKRIPFRAFEVITPAVIHRQELVLDYVKPSSTPAEFRGLAVGPDEVTSRRDSEPGLRRIEPLHIACIDFCWYLFAWDPAQDDVRTFALRRIRSVQMTGAQCPRRRFDIRKELKDSFGAYRGGKGVAVRLRLWGHAASVIPELEWHHSQKFSAVPTEQEHPDFPGQIEMTMRVAVNPKLIGWVKEWLGEIAVIEPASLREDVRAAALKGIADLDRFAAMGV